VLDGAMGQLGALTTAEGARLAAAVRAEADLSSAALIVRLRATWDAELVATALQQEKLRRRAAEKYTRASEMFFTAEGLEQATAEVVARHRASQFAAWAGEPMLDLCCGIGGDAVFLAAQGPVTGVDLDANRIACAQLNAQVYGVTAKTHFVQADVVDTPVDRRHRVFVDPSRRENGRRRGSGWYQPSLEWCLGLGDRAASVAIKAAPGIGRDLVPECWGLEFVAVGRALKEAVLWSPSAGMPGRLASVLPVGAQLTACPGERVTVAAPGRYLLDPSPAVTRAELVEDLARMLHAWQIDAQIAFLSTDNLVPTPFGRWLRIEDSRPWNVNDLRKVLRARDVGQVDIRRRGLAGDTEQIARDLKLQGQRKVTLVMTRVDDQPWAFVCVDA
jgi:SAM-dependent methyltransferase